MKLPLFPRRARPKAPRSLSAALGNPYRPVFGRERRFEELVRAQNQAQKQKSEP